MHRSPVPRAVCPALLHFLNTLAVRLEIFRWHRRQRNSNANEDIREEAHDLRGGAMDPAEHKAYNRGLEVSFKVRTEVGLSKAQIRALLRADVRLVKKLGQAHATPMHIKDWLQKAAETLGMTMTKDKGGGKKGTSKPAAQQQHHARADVCPPTQQPKVGGKGSASSTPSTAKMTRPASGTKGKGSSAKGPHRPETEEPAVFELEGKWNYKTADGAFADVPIVTKLDDTRPGVCLQQDVACVAGLAAKLRHSPHPAAVITPFPVEEGAIKSTRLPVQLKRTKGGNVSQVQVMGFITPLSKFDVLPEKKVESVSATRATSMVFTVQVDAKELDDDVCSGLKASRPADIRAAFHKLLPIQMRAAIVDVWQIKEHEHAFHMRVRIKEEAATQFMQFSGVHKVWVDTPKERQSSTRLTWLRTRAEGTVTWMEDEKVQEACRTLTHLGLVRRHQEGQWHYALRCLPEHHPAVKKFVGLSGVKPWILDGAPVEMTAKEVQEFAAKALEWNSPAVEDTSCRIRRNKASWLVRCDHDPKYRAAPLLCADESFSITVRPREESHAAPEVPVTTPTMSTTWSNAMAGKYQSVTKKKEYVDVARAATKVSESAPKRAKVSGPSAPPPSPLVRHSVPNETMGTVKQEIAELKTQIAQILQILGATATGQKRPLDLSGGGEEQQQGIAPMQS